MTRRVGEQAEQDRAEEAADEVHGDDVERVVVAEPELQADREVADRARDEPDGDRRHAADEAGARRDRDEAGDRARRGAERGGVAGLAAARRSASRASPAAAATNVFRNACAATPFAASAEPALNPNQPNHRMPVPSSVSGSECGGIGVLRPAPALAEHEHERERGGAGVDVHDGAAGEVERAALGEPAAGEHPVRDRRVHEQRPERDEADPRRRTACGRRSRR